MQIPVKKCDGFLEGKLILENDLYLMGYKNKTGH